MWLLDPVQACSFSLLESSVQTRLFYLYKLCCPNYQDVGHSGLAGVSEGNGARVSAQGLLRLWKSCFKVYPNRDHVESSFRRGLRIFFLQILIVQTKPNFKKRLERTKLRKEEK